MPNGSDESLVSKLHAAFDKLPFYTRPRGQEPVFTVRHYAGSVQYDAFRFLDKNRNNLAADLVGAMGLSDNALVSELFEVDDQKTSARSARKAGGAGRRGGGGRARGGVEAGGGERRRLRLVCEERTEQLGRRGGLRGGVATAGRLRALHPGAEVLERRGARATRRWRAARRAPRGAPQTRPRAPCAAPARCSRRWHCTSSQ